MAVFRILFLVFCSFSLIFAESFEDDNEIEGDDDLANYLREAIENFRSQMSTGIPEINMPVLDPLHLEDMDVNVNENVANINLRIQEISVSGLSNFSIFNLVPNLEEFYIQLNLSVPHIIIGGNYSLNGRLMTVFPIYGDGNFTINITELVLGGTGQLHFNRDGMQMDLLGLDLNFEEITMDLGKNFLGGGRFGAVMQQVIPGVGRDVFMLYKPVILREIQTALSNEINKELDKPAVKNIIKDIIPFQ